MIALALADFNGHALMIKMTAFGRIDGGGPNKSFYCPQTLAQWFQDHRRTFYAWRRSILV
ncbi:MAG: hypothetical protein GY738_08220, partial [Pseudoalteromonas sp.]|nr:hypothetical protein [Pseudoalteromonas sp.]